MNEKLISVKIGYSDLDWDERKEIRDFIEEFERKEYSDKRELNEGLRKSLGPINSATCPVCGK